MTKRNIIMLAVVALVGVSGYYVYDTYINPTEKKIRDRFSDNLFIVQHDYAYKVVAQTEDGSKSIYLVKNPGNQFDVWEPGNTGNRLFATALMMDSSGVCITSSYAAEPWKNAEDIRSLKKLFATETGVAEEDVEVTGRTIRMVIRPISMMGTGNTTEFECVVYEKTSGQPEELAFIGRKESEAKLPFKKLDLGGNYPQFREKDKTLFVLSVPVYDFTAAMPVKPGVTGVRSAGDDDYGTFFNDPPTALVEGSPVFDSRLNLVGVYTSVSRSSKPYYVSHYVRSSFGPSLIPRSVIADYVKNIDSIPPVPDNIVVPPVIQTSVTDLGIEFPFVAEAGWSILEEKTSDRDGIQPVMDPSVTNFTTGSHSFYDQKARFRIIIEGNGPVDVGLMTDKNGFIQVDYSEKISKSKTVDLGVLDGSYAMSVLHDNYTKVRFVFERSE